MITSQMATTCCLYSHFFRYWCKDPELVLLAQLTQLIRKTLLSPTTSSPTGAVEADAPDTPTLQSPVNGSSVDGNNFTMLASALAPSTQTLKSTTFQVSASADFSSTVVNETVPGATSLTVVG